MPESLTCQICHSAPAARLVVVDPPGNPRLQRLACVKDAEWWADDASAQAGWIVRQFDLLPVTGEEAGTPAGTGGSAMTLDEAREHVGYGVAYSPEGGEPEVGVITRVSTAAVFVRYGGLDATAKATRPEDIELIAEG